MLELKNISKSYPQRGLVLNDLSLSVSRGDSVAIMGPSGSGKTTLMNLIGLLDKPDSGSLVFNGRDITGLSDDESAAHRNRNIGFVFQEHLLLPYLTVRENILLPLLASGEKDQFRAEKISNAEELMKRTGIHSLSDKLPSRISGGEAQRTALVRALVNKPSLILADEPTGSLDAGNSALMGDLLSELNRLEGVTIILSTHSASLAGKMGRTLNLFEGRLSANRNDMA
ncbi:MAG: ABC transporter ATP-binding protein [Bacteroidales bacterium]|jgi:ABC-type lipoprotein export system ATPase subunit|nr:ABC transporter ATP-binding protein [Bacteroidales bacterium]MCU0409062.1 ABC transporter ATP-binding protein [Bacteroidales bacterium]